MSWLQDLTAWVIHWAQTPAGPQALWWLAVAESVCFPIPPDILLIALDVITPERSFWFAWVCTLGSVGGGVAGYAIGRWGGRPMLERFVQREHIAFVERQFHKYDVWAVAIAGFTPIPYKVFTIASGTFRIRFWRFVIASFLSRGARFFLVSALIAWFGARAQALMVKYIDLFSMLLLVLLIGGFVALRWMTKREVVK